MSVIDFISASRSSVSLSAHYLLWAMLVYWPSAVEAAGPPEATEATEVPEIVDLTADQSQIPAELQPAWRATVKVEMHLRRPGAISAQRSYGSGFLVAATADASLIGTSAHVVPCRPACSLRVGWVDIDGRETWQEALVYWRDTGQDLALLVTGPPPSISPLQPASSQATRSGEELWTMGFPDPHLLPKPQRSRLRRAANGTLVAKRTQLAAKYRAYAATKKTGELNLAVALVHTAKILPGSSGGPVINRHGQVVAVVTGSLEARRSKQDRSMEEPVYVAVVPDELWRLVARWRIQEAVSMSP